MKQIPIANWKVPKAASSVVRPSHINGATQLMLVSVLNYIINLWLTSSLKYIPWDVNGAATEASAIDRDIPASAVLKAPQSLHPSPTMATCRL